MSLLSPATAAKRRPRPVDRGRLGALAEAQLEVFERRTPLSRRHHERAAGALAASPPARGPWPVHLERSEGSHAWDLDGNCYTAFDAASAQRPHGASDPAGRDPVTTAEDLARRFGLARWRFARSGGEAVMQALQLARAATGRDAILKAEGAFHGSYDPVMVSVTPPLAALGDRDDPLSIPHGPGYPPAFTDLTGAVPFNDAAALESVLARIGTQVAALILEPAMTGIGLISPREGYLERVRELSDLYGVLLVFDETRTATLGPGGGTRRFGVAPDLIALAGATGMSAELAAGAPSSPGPAAAPPAELPPALSPDDVERVEELNRNLIAGSERLIAEYRLPAHATGLGAKGAVHFAAEPIHDYREHLAETDRELAALAWLYRINHGVYTDPSAEDWTISAAHDTDSVAAYLEALEALAGDLRQTQGRS